MTLEQELDRIVHDRDRDDMQPTIDALLPLLQQHPDNGRVLYEVGGAYDTAGQEHTAVTFYERALAAGLTDDVLVRCFLQYGSTLRNLGEVEKSRDVFDAARRRFPDSTPLAVFATLTTHAGERLHTAIAELLQIIADRLPDADLDRYRPALRGNADYIRSLDTDEPA